MHPFLKLIRPKQYAKNVFVFAALVFTGTFRDPRAVAFTLLAFAGMCAISSATYVFNDLVDVERDRKHPTKCRRPIASGQVPERTAFLAGIALGLIGFVLEGLINRTSIAIVGAYVLLQVLYNWKLKRTPIADVFTISIGFVLRAVLGAAAIDAKISGWLLFCTGALSLMLGFAKRRNEFLLQGEDRTTSRESLVHYTQPALDALVTMFASGAAMSYCVYTLQSNTAHKYPALILTSVFVLYGITRYLLVTFTANEGGEPADLLFKDQHLLASVLGFLITAILALGGMRLPFIEQ